MDMAVLAIGAFVVSVVTMILSHILIFWRVNWWLNGVRDTLNQQIAAMQADAAEQRATTMAVVERFTDKDSRLREDVDRLWKQYRELARRQARLEEYIVAILRVLREAGLEVVKKSDLMETNGGG